MYGVWNIDINLLFALLFIIDLTFFKKVCE